MSDLHATTLSDWRRPVLCQGFNVLVEDPHDDLRVFPAGTVMRVATVQSSPCFAGAFFFETRD